MAFQNFPQAYQQNPYIRTQQTNGIRWVQGIEGAKAWQMMPNSNDVLLDSENNGIFYIKICDGVGMYTLRRFRYEEISDVSTTEKADLSEYVKKSELQELIKSMLGGNSNEQSISRTDGKSNKQKSSDTQQYQNNDK